MGNCQVCGRRLVTGRKYCYEHRNTAGAEYVKRENLIEQASKGYKRHKLGWFWLSIYRYWYVFVIASGMVMWLFANSPNNKNWLSSLFLILMFVFIILKLVVSFKLFLLQKKIDKRATEYVDWVKGWSSLDKEEKEFKKYLTE